MVLLIYGKNLFQADPERLKYQQLENHIQKIEKYNQEIKKSIQNDEQKMDSISLAIDRVESNIKIFDIKRQIINKKYESEIKELENKTLDELKKIALEK